MRVRLNSNLKVKETPGKKFSDYHLLASGVYSDNDPGGIPDILIKEIEMGRPTVTILDGLSTRDFLESRGPQDEPNGTVNTMDSGEGDTRLAERLKDEPVESPEKEPIPPSPKKSSGRKRRRKA